MTSDHRKDLERNELAAAAETLYNRVKTGKVISPRVLAFIAAIILVLGIWWYISSSGKSSASAQWSTFEKIGSRNGLEEFTKVNATDTPGKIARLQLARIKLGSDGLAKLARSDTRPKAIAAIEEARAEVLKLADEFKGDKTLRAQCLDLAAKAELALVGIPKEGSSTEYRGTVEGAVAHLSAIAETVGATTAAGEAVKKMAADLEKNRERVIELGTTLNSQLMPAPPAPEIKTPGSLNPSTPPLTVPGMTLPGGIQPANPPAPSTPTPPAGAAAAGGAATAPKETPTIPVPPPPAPDKKP